MNPAEVIEALSALAHETRLSAFRSLVEAGPSGMAAGELARELNVPAATLSFHLKELMHAGLATSQRSGRSIIYAAHFNGISAVVDYLTENCCRRTRRQRNTPKSREAKA